MVGGRVVKYAATSEVTAHLMAHDCVGVCVCVVCQVNGTVDGT